MHNHDESKNDEVIRLQLNLVDEVRATAEQKLAQYQDHMAKHYNSRVRHRDFLVGDLVLRKVMDAARDPTQRKLSPNWKGPYQITSWQRNGTYHLETLDDRSYNIHGTPSTCGSTTSKVDGVKSNTPLFFSIP